MSEELEKTELMEIPEFTPIVVDNAYQIQNYDVLKEALDKYLSNIDTSIVITDAMTYKDYKSIRRDLNKKEKNINDNRLKINRFIVGIMDDQLKAMEKEIHEKSEQCSILLEDYETQILNKSKAPKLLTLEIKAYDENTLLQIAQYAESLSEVKINKKWEK